MNSKDKKRLQEMCRKLGIDFAEIDSSISFDENLEILGIVEKDPDYGVPELPPWFENYAAAKLYERCFEKQVKVKARSGFNLLKYALARKHEADVKRG